MPRGSEDRRLNVAPAGQIPKRQEPAGQMQRTHLLAGSSRYQERLAICLSGKLSNARSYPELARVGAMRSAVFPPFLGRTVRA